MKKILVFLSLVFLVSCTTSKIGSDCGLCNTANEPPPDGAAIYAATVEAYNQAKTTCVPMQATTVYHYPSSLDPFDKYSETPVTMNFPVAPPNPIWHKCDFIAKDPKVTPLDPSIKPGICASGLTDSDNRVVHISLGEKARVIPLLIWETRNYYWVKYGCGDQAY